MAKHYWQIDLKTSRILDDEDVQELEEVIRLAIQDRTAGVVVEYVDSEG